MDPIIKTICAILEAKGDVHLANLLHHSNLDLMESGTYGSRAHSIITTAVISSLPIFNNQLTDLPLKDKNKITNAILQVYPVMDDAPEITEVIYRAKIYPESKEVKLYGGGPAKPIRKVSSSQLDLTDNHLLEDENELVMVDNKYFILTEESFLKQIEDNKKSSTDYFEIEGDFVVSFPDTFWELVHLKSLSIKACKIGTLPPEISKLKKLEFLEIEDSDISALPQEIASLQNLTHLILTETSLKQLPEEIGKLKNLTFIDLSKNNFTSLPGSLFELTSLVELHLNENQIEVIQEEFGNLKNLTSLSLNNNQISELPDDFFDLPNLRNLYLNDNKLKFLPPSVSKLIKLEELFLHNNNLESLPFSLSALKNISSLTFEDNPFTDMPEIQDKNLIQLYFYLDEKGTKKPFVTHWDIPESFRIAFQQYLNYFSEFVHKLHGEEIIFEAQKTSTGLKLITEPTDTLPIHTINELLEMYMQQDKDIIPPAQDFNVKYEYEVMKFKSDMELQKQNFSLSLRQEIKHRELLEKVLASKEKENESLNIRIRFFEDTLVPRLLQLVPKNNTGYDLSLEMKYTKLVDDFSEMRRVIENIDKQVADDLSLSNTQREQAYIAFAEILEELKVGKKPNQFSLNKVTEILKAGKELGGFVTQLISLSKNSSE